MIEPPSEWLFSLDMPLPPPGRPAPVWVLLVPQEVSRRRMRELFALLDGQEQERARGTRSATRRADFIAGHGWRRALLSMVVDGVSPPAWRFGTGASGRPLLLHVNGLCDTSLSYAAGATAVAVAIGCRVGVDIETADDHRPEASREEHRDSSGPRRPVAVDWCASFQDWTVAEAVGKCLGIGLPDAFEFIRGTSPPAAGVARVSLFRRLAVVGTRSFHVAVAAAPLADA